MEVNIYKKSISRNLRRVAYVYPSLYRVMISGLAPDIVYSMVNEYNEVYLERFTCKSLYGLEEEPSSLETGSRLRDFPLIITSLHYEPDIVNLSRLLLASGISTLSKNRNKHVIIAGGPVCMENPIPYSDIIDAFVIGEAEVTLDKIIEYWLMYYDSKKRFLEEIASLNYIYVPGLKDTSVTREYVKDLDSVFYPIRQVENIEVEPIYGRGFKLEASRGCLYWCSFCLESRVFNPYRERSLSRLKSILEDSARYTLSGKRIVLFSLVFPVTSTHYNLLEYLDSEDYIASFPSLRITPLLEKSLELIKRLGQRTLVLAPESFSPIIQSIFSKYTGRLDYVNYIIRRILDEGFDVKLYLIYGFKSLISRGFEEDVASITSIVKYAKQRGRKVVVSLNPLVPKPRTMFQWIGMPTREELQKILRTYRHGLKNVIESRAYDIDWAIIQAQLSLSSKPLGNFITKWAGYGGGLSGWRRAIRDLGVNYKYVFTGYEYGEELPWEFIKLDEVGDKVANSQYYVYKKYISSS